MMLDSTTSSLLQRLAAGVARQFGSHCEVLVHDLRAESLEHTIVAIENGHVSGRKVGDGPSQAVLDALRDENASLEDQLGYLTTAHDGRILKSSTIFVRDADGKAAAIFGINYDITPLLLLDSAIKPLTDAAYDDRVPQRITQNVNDLLDDLIDKSVRLVGKPVALMTKEDKVRAIRFLNEHGAFLITKSGDKISRHFGISKYTLYSYIDAASRQED